MNFREKLTLATDVGFGALALFCLVGIFIKPEASVSCAALLAIMWALTQMLSGGSLALRLLLQSRGSKEDPDSQE